MNKNKLKALLPPIISLLICAALGALMLYLYGITKYHLLYLTGLILILPCAVNAALLFLKLPLRPGSTPSEEATEAEGTPISPKARFLYTLKKAFGKIGAALSPRSEEGAKKLLLCIGMSVAAVLFGALQFFFATALGKATALYQINYAYAVLLIAIFLIFIVLDKWILHSGTDDEYASALGFNARSALAVARLSLLTVIPSMFIKLLGLYELQTYAIIILAIIFYWSSLFLLISVAARAVRRELATSPDIRIPAPFSGGIGKDMGIISYLENNTGITMRGLWSVRLIKKLTVPSLVALFMLFWLSTGIVEVGSGQHAALYNFGRLASDPLEPGLHMTLPWPFGKAVIYNTDAVSSMTIGYRSDTSGDNVWTQTHGSEEYELLLGGGEELVSINLCIEYKISDLHSYLINCANPEAILEASAYELVADKTIVTDLNTLLSVDREAFASEFMTDLKEKISIRNTGLEIVSVVLESIHPPLGIADIYQQLVSAEIEAATRIMNAEAFAAVRVLEAETLFNTMLTAAQSERLSREAGAHSSVAEFMASVSADTEYSDAYRYYKYLNALIKAYGKADLIIVGSDVDQSRIYFGSLTK